MDLEHTAADNEVNIIAAIGLHERQKIADMKFHQNQTIQHKGAEDPKLTTVPRKQCMGHAKIPV